MLGVDGGQSKLLSALAIVPIIEKDKMGRMSQPKVDCNIHKGDLLLKKFLILVLDSLVYPICPDCALSLQGECSNVP